MPNIFDQFDPQTTAPVVPGDEGASWCCWHRIVSRPVDQPSPQLAPRRNTFDQFDRGNSSRRNLFLRWPLPAARRSSG